MVRCESRSSTIGHITLGTKQTGAPSAGNPHAGCDAAGAGNGFTVWLLRHSQRKRGETDRPDLRNTAPVLDPTRRVRGYDNRMDKPKPKRGAQKPMRFGEGMKPGTVEWDLNQRRLRAERREDDRQWTALQAKLAAESMTFGVLYCFFVIAHDRRRILH